MTEKPLIDDSNNSKTIRKNFIIITITSVLIFTAFNAVTNLQSSINVDHNIGLYSLAIICGSAIFSSIFLTNFISFLAGYKWTIFLSHFGFIAFVAANIYPKVWLMYPASVLCGFSRAIYGTSVNAYVSDLGKRREKNGYESRVTRYFGFYFSFFLTSQIWGNLISFLIINFTEMKPIEDNLYLNILRFVNKHFFPEEIVKCGESYLPREHMPKRHDPDQLSMKTGEILFGTFAGIIALSFILMLLFLSQKQHSKKITSHGLYYQSSKHLSDIFKQLISYKQIILLPLPFWIGTFQGFTYAIFTKSFITCPYGVKFIGLIMMTYGIGACLFGLLVGYAEKYHFRSILFSFAALISFGTLLLMLLWQPVSSEMYVSYIIAALLGITQAVWDPITTGLYENIFFNKREAAYSIMMAGEFTGYMVIYLYARFIRTDIAIILQIVYLTIAVISYTISALGHYFKQLKRKPVSFDHYDDVDFE